MILTKCTHGMPSPASCIECMNEGGLGAPPREPIEVVARFAAKFDGDCHECNLPISAGQRVAKLSNDAYVHDSCAHEATDLFGHRT